MLLQFIGATLFEVSVIAGCPNVLPGEAICCAAATQLPVQSLPHVPSAVTLTLKNFLISCTAESSTNWWTWDACFWAMQACRLCAEAVLSLQLPTNKQICLNCMCIRPSSAHNRSELQLC